MPVVAAVVRSHHRKTWQDYVDVFYETTNLRITEYVVR